MGHENAGTEQAEEDRDRFDHCLASSFATPARKLLRDWS
jgi:hypothetical protein